MMASEKKADGGNAFPQAYGVFPGMTLRDWFAGQALTGVLSHDSVVHQTALTSGLPELQAAAAIAYGFADAMIKERDK